MDGEYLCSHCYRLAWGKRQPNDGELRAFMDDPDSYTRTDVLDNELVKHGRYDDRHRELLAHARDLEDEIAMLKETILKMIEADAR
jgi:hypothetical protein